MSYIGNQPVLDTSEFREEFSVTNNTQTVFNTGGFTASADSSTLEILRNGVLLGTADYTLGSDASTVTLANAAVSGDIIVIKGRRELTNGVQVTERRHEHTMGSGETTVTFPYPLTVSQTDVYLNGVKLGSSDFSINSSTRVVNFTTNPAVGDLVAIVSREPALTANSSLPVVDAAGNNVLSESGGVVTLTADAAVIEGSSSGDLVRITQSGAGNALVVEDSTNPDSTPFVVDSSGRIGIGVASPVTLLDLASNGGSVAFFSSYANSAAGKIEIRRATGTITSPSIVSNGQTVGQFGFSAYDGTGFIEAARIRTEVDGTPGTNDMPGRLVFSTTADGSSGVTERMRIDSSGNVGIGTTSVSYQLQLSTDSAGKPSTNTWTVVSDERIKENIELADLDLCYDAVKNIPLKRFKWRDEVYSEEMVADRHKLGWIAQDVEAVYPKAVNIHEFKYNQVYSDVIIPAVEEELDTEGNVITEAQEERIEKKLVSEEVIEDCRNLNADQIYAAMYGSIQKLIQKVESQQSTIEILTARIEALETN